MTVEPAALGLGDAEGDGDSDADPLAGDRADGDAEDRADAGAEPDPAGLGEPPNVDDGPPSTSVGLGGTPVPGEVGTAQGAATALPADWTTWTGAECPSLICAAVTPARVIGSRVLLKIQKDSGAAPPWGYPLGPAYSTVALRTNTSRPSAWALTPGTPGWICAVWAI